MPVDFKKDHATDRYNKALKLLGILNAKLDYEIRLDEANLPTGITIENKF